jgi:UDP-N-acetylmuramoyl-tripeptide--D-alanyl-D-alanine ligase
MEDCGFKEEAGSMRLTLSQLQQAVGGELLVGPAATAPAARGAGRIVTDSRRVEPGDIFWALTGPRHNGGDFLAEAYAHGAIGAVAAGASISPPPGRWTLRVRDGLQALTELARWKRSAFKGSVIAVTGSVGKTTTRQMIHTVLSTRLSGTCSPHSYNNQVGLPLSMLAIEPQHDFAVLELGASACGEIAALAKVCAPRIGVITRVGDAHLGGFGSREAVAESKAELIAALPPDGVAVLNGDDHWLRAVSGRTAANIIWVGRGVDCDLVATHVRFADGLLSFRCDGRAFEAPVWGRHYLTSALVAIAAGRLLGISTDDVAAGLSRFEPPPQRCEVSHLHGVALINDTYNASPQAMQAALELLRDINCRGRRIVVCGDMRELGAAAEEMHHRLGEQVVTLCGADLLIACGEHAFQVAAGAELAGMASSRIAAFRRADEIMPLLAQLVAPGDAVLIKGSRALGMESVARDLTAHLETMPPTVPLRRSADNRKQRMCA